MREDSTFSDILIIFRVYYREKIIKIPNIFLLKAGTVFFINQKF